VNTQSYPCARKPDGCEKEQLTQIGDFSWRYFPANLPNSSAGRLAGMNIRMPTIDGKGSVTWLHVKEPDVDQGWAFDGNLDAPTLTPSLLFRKTEWHGHLRAGRLESC
jgi:hypothetical protein